MEALTGTGLAASSGMNAYLPLLAVGLLGRFTDVITVPPGWSWLENPWVLGILTVLLVIEFVADKVPAIDHVNDIIQTVVRPTSGGITFGAAASGETFTLADPSTFFQNGNWLPVVIGVVVALFFHGGKAVTRAAVNVTTAGVGAPVASLIEDFVSVVLVLVAIFVPVLVIFFIAVMALFFFWAFRRWRRRRAAKRARLAATVPAS
ncbi:DUF4126 domain-containing protein [Fodinicola acaciae]|uniref:DUF4126 domain-containing protein n=1 Tax=Fodinicola acaciae TaxID=2681555 RepID=UPI001C9E24C2|nr:DUF4126 domain-containing protein [Fodinicola acaciae]